jgi:TPR repeat protein
MLWNFGNINLIMKNIKQLLLTILFLVAPFLVNADYKDGHLAYEKGDYITAFEEWEPLAEQEHIGAQGKLISMYKEGKGVQKDLTKADYWTARRNKAALYGIEESISMMKYYSLSKEGNDIAALKELKPLATKGYPLAQLNLGITYAQGDDAVLKDIKKAKFWIQKAFNNPHKSEHKRAKKAWDKYELWKY